MEEFANTTSRDRLAVRIAEFSEQATAQLARSFRECSHDWIEDAVEDACVEAMGDVEAFSQRYEEDFARVMLRVARNRLLDRIRRESRYRSIASDEIASDEIADESRNLDGSDDEPMRLGDISEELAQYHKFATKGQRQVLAALSASKSRDWGKRIRLASRRLGKSERSIKVSLWRMKKRLIRHQLEREESFAQSHHPIGWLWQSFLDQSRKRYFTELSEFRTPYQWLIKDYPLSTCADYLEHESRSTRVPIGVQNRVLLICAEFHFERGSHDHAIRLAQEACCLADSALNARDKYISNFLLAQLQFTAGHQYEGVRSLLTAINRGPLHAADSIEKLSATVQDPLFAGICRAYFHAKRIGADSEASQCQHLLRHIQGVGYAPVAGYARILHQNVIANNNSDFHASTILRWIPEMDGLPSSHLDCKVTRTVLSGRRRRFQLANVY